MKKLGQKTFYVIVSSLMMLALLPTNLTTINATGTTDVSSFDANLLGEAMNYGVVANSISLGAHMDSNFAAKEWNYNGNITLGQYTNQPGSIVVGNIKSNTLTVTSTTGKPYVKCATDQASKISFDKEQGVIVTDTEQNIDNYIDGLISPIVESAESMLNMTTLTYGVDFAKIGSKDANGITIDANNYALDFTKYNDDVIYLHGASELLEAAKNMHIIKNDNQKIIFNIDNTSKTVTLNQFQVIFNGVQYDSAAGTDEAKNTANESIAETIIFNMPNATVLNIASGITGTVLAPKASVSFSGTSCGWLICDKISGSSAEWHSIYKHVKNTVVPGNVKLTATKSVDGKEPTEDQIFDFTLSEYNENFESLITPTYAADNKTQYVNTKIVHNSGKDISMDLTELGFAEFNTVGTRYFKLTENDATGYEENNTAYYIVIDTTVSGGNATRTYTSTATIYSDYSKGVVYNGTMAFENKTTKPATTSISVKKVWDDSNNQDGTRTADVTIDLLANGTPTGKTVVLDASNEWGSQEGFVAFKDLAVNDNGTAITYSVAEETQNYKDKNGKALTGYEVTVTGDAANGFTVTNTHTPATTSISVKKVWDDSNNQDGTRTADVTIDLLANGTPTGKTVVLDASNEWGSQEGFVAFKLLAVNDNGTAITYSVAEETQNYKDKNGKALTGYEVTVTGDAANGFTVTNTHTPATTSISVKKVWDDSNNQDGTRTADVTIDLLANGTPTGKTVVLDASNEWGSQEGFVAFKDLAVNDNGTAITYSVAEETQNYKDKNGKALTGYEVTVTGDAANGFTVTNTHTPATTSISVKKVWDDNNNQYNVRPTSVTFQLQKTVDGKTSDVKDKTVVLNDENAWTYTFEDLPKYEGGKEITYSAVETSTDKNYTSEANGLTVKNTLITGKLVIKKTFAGTEIPDTAKNKLNFKVTGPNNYEKTISYAEFTNGEYTLDYILAGDYKVEEVNNVVDGYRAVVTYSVNGKTGQTASVDANTTPVFAITNTYVETPKTPTTPTPTPDRPTTPTTPDRPTTPNTGDQTNLPMAAAGMLFGTMAAMFVVFFKRKYSD